MKTKRTAFLILTALLLVILSGLIFYYFIALQPVRERLAATEQKLRDEEKLLNALTQKTQEAAAIKLVDLRELQQKVPTESFVDGLILDLKAVEEASNSEILSVSLAESPYVPPAADNAGQSSEETANTAATDQQAAGLQRVTLTLSVKSPTYDNLQQFILGVEGANRIVKVDALNMIDASDTHALTLSTFYAPAFIAIQDKLPRIVFPEPSGRTIPFSSPNFGSSEEASNRTLRPDAAVPDDSETPSSIAEQNHVAQPED